MGVKAGINNIQSFVAQGSVPGPLLFILEIKSMTCHLSVKWPFQFYLLVIQIHLQVIHDDGRAVRGDPGLQCPPPSIAPLHGPVHTPDNSISAYGIPHLYDRGSKCRLTRCILEQICIFINSA